MIRRQCSPAVFQPLEGRTLLAVSVGYDAPTNTVTITGSEANDIVTLGSSSGQLFGAGIGVPGIATGPTLKIVVNALGGSDSIYNYLPANQYQVATLNGGDGNDSMKAGYGVDVINGGAGNDRIETQSLSFGKQTIYGDDGDDTISTRSSGEVFIDAGAGNDKLYITVKNPSTYKGTFYTGTGTDSISVAGISSKAQFETMLKDFTPGVDTVRGTDLYGNLLWTM
jgi:Ca2+-binding RTX toxin-like protein